MVGELVPIQASAPPGEAASIEIVCIPLQHVVFGFEFGGNHRQWFVDPRVLELCFALVHLHQLQ